MLKPLPEPDRFRCVLGFDFDDTLLLKHGEERFDSRFFDSIREARSDEGAIWGIATGRSLYQLIEGFSQIDLPFLPDYVVTREREVYFPGDFGRWQPHEEWNRACEKDHAKLFRKARRPLKKIRQFVEEETEARWSSVEGDEAGIVATSVNEMDKILGHIEAVKTPAALTYERNTIYLRFSHHEYHKGSGLLKAAEKWGVGPEGILAVGDNFNDLSMLQPEVSGGCGCPANSVQFVKDFVHGRGGFVAREEGSVGAMEILAAYFE